MKKLYFLTLAFCAATISMAQTMKVHCGQVTVNVSAEEAGEMHFNAGESIEIQGRTYSLSDIDSITVDRSAYTASAVEVSYLGNAAHVNISGNIASLMTWEVSGNHVSLVAAPELQEEVTYTLNGTTTDGSFFMDGEYKSTLVLDNLNMTNKSGAAIDIANGKRIKVIIPTGTATTLTDAAGGLQKACLFINGHAEFSGGGALVLNGCNRHAYASDEYTWFEKDFGTLTIERAEGDGLHVEQYFRMDGGQIHVKNAKGDGIDVPVTKDPTDEYNGQVFVNGGNITLNAAAEDVKGLKCDSMMTISGGSIKATVSGNGTKGISVGTNLLVGGTNHTKPSIEMTVTGTTYMPGDPVSESKCRGIKVKGDFTLDGGTVRISATGVKSKAVSVDGNYYYKSGSINCAVDASNL